MSQARNGATAEGAANWLSLAAAPTFGMMALLTHFGGGPPEALCSTGTVASFGGMVPMYLLMSAVHSAPWLRLMAGRA